METNENKRPRDYSHEYQIRLKRNKRLVCDMDKDKAEQFQILLKGRGVTFAKWLENKIDEEFKRA